MAYSQPRQNGRTHSLVLCTTDERRTVVPFLVRGV